MRYFPLKNVLVAAVAGLGLLVSLSANAAPIPFNAALSITGTASLDTVNSTAAAGGVTQTGDFSVTAGGATAATSFTGLTTLGANPQSQALTALGDGLSMRFNLAGAFDGGAAEQHLFGDQILILANTSATDTFEIVLGTTTTHTLSAAGGDAFVIGEWRIEDALHNLLVFANHTRDTVNGDADTALSASSFSITLAPGDSAQFDGVLKLEGGAFLSGSIYSGEFASTFTVDAVRNLTSIPEPTTLLLLGVGLAGWGWLRRSRAADASKISL